MKFSIGDKILLKRTGEEGHVVAFIDKEMMEVEVGKTTFPVYIDDVDHPYLTWFTTKAPKKKPVEFAEIPVEKIKERAPRLSRGAYLSFIPVFKTIDQEEIVDFLKIHLLNELPVAVKFSYEVRLDHQSLFKHQGVVHEFGNIYLNNVSYIDMGEQPRFHWKLVNTQQATMETAEGVLKIRPSKLFEQVNQVMMQGSPSFSYLLIDDFIPKKKVETPPAAEPVKTGGASIHTAKMNLEPARQELDLHIEQLDSNWTKLTTAEIIKKQLDTFEKYLHLAIVHHLDRMVVIHGLGKGKLREEVHLMLKKTPEVSRFKNEWSGKYGFGATEIYFKSGF